MVPLKSSIQVFGKSIRQPLVRKIFQTRNKYSRIVLGDFFRLITLTVDCKKRSESGTASESFHCRSGYATPFKGTVATSKRLLYFYFISSPLTKNHAFVNSKFYSSVISLIKNPSRDSSISKFTLENRILQKNDG